MKSAHWALGAVSLAFAIAASAETLEIAGTPAVQQRIDRYVAAIEARSGVELSISSVGGGKGLLDLVEGKVAVAAISGSIDEAIASARKQAIAEGKSFVMPATLKFYRIARASGDDHPIGFVTIGTPVPSMQKILKYFGSREGRMLMLRVAGR